MRLRFNCGWRTADGGLEGSPPMNPGGAFPVWPKIGRWLASGLLGLGMAWPAFAAEPQASSTNATAGATTNAMPHFVVEGYEVLGITLLPEETIKAIFGRHTGTNVGFEDVSSGIKELQAEYH